MSVKRYEFELYHCNSGEMLVSDTGDYVSYEDYAALEARCAALAADNKKAMEAMRQADADVKLAHEKFSALAAENAGLIEQSEGVYAAGYNHGHLNTVDGIAYADCVKDDFYCLAVELMREAETPATDAFLAEVRAQGVEMAACALDDVNQFNYANMLDDLAQKLRKGATL